jgi:type I restriction enzyme M protein
LITGATKNKIDDIWKKMWEGGITNPIEVISQLTYLMFMHQLDEKEFEAENMESVLGVEQKHIFPKTYFNAAGLKIAGEEMRWSRFKDKPAEVMFRTVSEFAFPFIKTLGDESSFTRSMESATFGIPTPKTLQRAVDSIDTLFESYVKDISDLGDLYEYMLSKLNTAGTNGQFRTPKHIRDMMVRFIEPKPSQLICDPAMGTAGFLISAAEYIRSNYESAMTQSDWDCFAGGNGAVPQFTGFEIDQTMLRISAMNLMLHGVDKPDVRYLDSISKNNAISLKYDCILANPPFTGSVDTEDIDNSLKAIVDSKQTELLFVALFLRMLKLGGRCACIVPNGVLFRTNSKAYRQLRKELVDNHKLEAIIYMPSGVFKPYSGVSTAVLVFTKTGAGGTDDVWLYNMEGDGFTLDDKRDPDAAHDDIPDILSRWSRLDVERERSRTDKSFLVPAQEIRDNDYDFSFNKYTETVYERIEYPPTEEILADLEAINQRIVSGLAELKKMLSTQAGEEEH